MSLAARALIVYHREEDLNFVRKALQEEGWFVDDARNGAEALRCAGRFVPQIIVSSLLMPVMDGLTLLKECKADEKLKHIPFVIYATEYTEPEGEQLVLTLGAAAFMSKPVEPERFIACVDAAVANARLGRTSERRPSAGEERILLRRYNDILIQWLIAHSGTSPDKPTGRTVVLAVAQDVADRDLGERMRKSHDRLRNVLDNIFTFVGVISTQGVLLEVNRAPLEMAGLRREDVIGKPLIETYWFSHSASSRERVRLALERAAQGENVRYDEVVRAANGQTITIDVTFGPARDDDGHVIEIVGSAVDITDRKRAEEALQESEKQYRLLFDSSPLPMWIYDLHTLAFLAVNEAAILHYGYSRQEFLSMSVSDITPQSDPATPENMDAVETEDKDKRTANNLSHRTKAGAIISVEITTHELAFHGKAAQLILANDITERLSSVASLRQSEERFSIAFRSSPVATTIATLAEGRYVDVNEAFLNMMGYQWEEVIGRTSQQLNVWEDTRSRAAMIEQLENTGHIRDFQTKLNTRGGEVRLVQIAAETIHLGHAPCILAMFQDITETKRLEDQFRQAQKMEAVGRLAGGVAHDFNNMLGVILGYSGLAQERLNAEHPVWDHIEQIRKAAERATELTRQLLAFSRRQVLKPSVLNLNAVVNNVSKMLLRVIGEDISLRFVPDANLGNVRLDLGQIEQVLMNLTVNARDAMPRGGKIVIETENVELDETYAQQHLPVKPGSYVMLTLTDTGIGMERIVLSQIFEPFFTTKPLGEGTGLGLSMVYGVVRQSGGTILAYSEPGRGTSFKLYFPRVRDVAISLLDTTPPSVIAGGSETILLVEDEDSLRKLTAKLLKDAGYRVLEASTGNSGFEMSERFVGAIHLLLTDVIMPGGSGSELAARLTQTRPQVKVLYMSGYTGNTIGNYGILESNIIVLQKPFTKHALLSKVRSALEQAVAATVQLRQSLE